MHFVLRGNNYYPPVWEGLDGCVHVTRVPNVLQSCQTWMETKRNIIISDMELYCSLTSVQKQLNLSPNSIWKLTSWFYVFILLICVWLLRRWRWSHRDGTVSLWCWGAGYWRWQRHHFLPHSANNNEILPLTIFIGNYTELPLVPSSSLHDDVTNVAERLFFYHNPQCMLPTFFYI